MPKGFFHGSEVIGKAPTGSIPLCGACGLYKHCQSPKMPPTGRGKRRVLVVGQSPGEREDEAGEPFVGPSGQLLKRTLRQLDVDLTRDCWITNALICHPPGDKIDDNRKIAYCRPNLIKTIKEFDPEVIIPLGKEAMISLISWLYRKDIAGDSVTKWLGWKIPDQTLNAWICPTWHPSYLLREANTSNNEVIQMFWKHHLSEAFKLKGRPWKTVPDYKSEVELVYKAREVIAFLRDIRRKGGLMAFDYETNRLKPDARNATIVCSSVCWEGKRTIAFPWLGMNSDVIKEWKLMLREKRLKKIASNIKFEDRWSNAVLRTKVRGWKLCTMIGAHVCDNRRDITSIKFQSYVRLGFGAYEENVKPFLATKGEDTKVNQILEEIDLNSLLLYNGLDSLLEYKVALDEMEWLGL